MVNAPNVIEQGYGAGDSSPTAAVKWCETYAKNHTENFTVVSQFLPKHLRGPMYIIYAYCRFTDDLGDEAAGDRLGLLDEWNADLRRAFSGAPQHPINIAVGNLSQDYPIQPEPFLRLNEANKLDQRKQRYATFSDVLDYCTLSANPVGQMVLSVFGYVDAERIAMSDATCTALQLANHWQDVARDYDAGRIYLPQEDLERYGVTEEQIAARRFDSNFRAMMQYQVDRAEALFRQGEPLASTVSRDLRVDLGLFTDGGRAILRAIARQGYDVLTHRPTVGTARASWMMARAASRRWIG
jgi:squalene synthase HpnC